MATKSSKTVAPTPAPGDLEIIRQFVGTTGSDGEPDELGRPEWLADWLVGHRLLADGTLLVEDDRRRAVQVREDVRLLLAANTGFEIDAEAVRLRLERAARGARQRLTFDRGGPAGFGAASGSFDDALGALLGIVAKARIAETWHLLKSCAREDCGRAFYDTSPNRKGLWCTKRCGNRVRAQEYRRTAKYKAKRKSRPRY